MGGFFLLAESLVEILKIYRDDGVDFLPKAISEKELFIDNLKKEVKNCKKCTLFKSRKNIVFGEGNLYAKLMFIGEAPGKYEDLSGKPFVGDAGKLLSKIIDAMHLKREDVYICNILKCRPPNNRDPLPEEVEKCLPFLIKQIELIKPEIIVTLGKISTSVLLNTSEKINKLRGKFYNYKGIKLLPTFHPAHLLHHPENKKFVWHDMQLVMKELNLN